MNYRKFAILSSTAAIAITSFILGLLAGDCARFVKAERHLERFIDANKPKPEIHSDPPTNFVILCNGKEWVWKVGVWTSLRTYSTREEAVAGAWQYKADSEVFNAHPFTNTAPEK